MSEPFIAEVRIFAGNFAPRGWAFCDGQLLPISQNTALFSLIGTTYGGDGTTTTALPNLQGRAVMHPGTGPGLTTRQLGQTGGAETVQLDSTNLANHSHTWKGITSPANDDEPNDKLVARGAGLGAYTDDTSNLTQMSSNAIANTGGNSAHNNMQPYIALNYIIALVGLYPSRN